MVKSKEERLFIILLFFALTGFGILAGAIWYLQIVGITSGTRIFLMILSIILFLLFSVLSIGLGSVVITLLLKKPVSVLMFFTQLAVEYLFPLTLYLGRVVGISKEGLQRAFIKVLNRLAEIRKIKINGRDLLVLLPHCLQNFDCKYKLTGDIENCRRCGKCTIDRLLDLKTKYNCSMAVVTGGTMARKIIKDIRPKAIVAVACERDLTSGIQDTYPIPVMGIINIRPHGPCINTQVDVDEVERGILKFIGRDD